MHQTLHTEPDNGLTGGPGTEGVVLRIIIGIVVLLILLAGVAVFSFSERIMQRFAERTESADAKEEAIQAAVARVEREGRPKMTRAEKLQFVQLVDLDAREGALGQPEGADLPTDESPVRVSCRPSTTLVVPGRSVEWSVSVIGGDLPYQYTWHGSEGLLGDGPTVTKVYERSGTKEASVTILGAGGTEVPLTVTCAPSVIVRVVADTL